MIPFSAFIIVPGGEILLPAYLKIFPNSRPSQFVSEADRKKKMHDFHLKQMEAADFLAKAWPQRVQKLLENEHIPEDDKEKIKQMQISMMDDDLATNLLAFRFQFQKYGAFKSFDPAELLYISKFIGKEPVTGLKFVNQLRSLVRLEPIGPQTKNQFLRRYMRFFQVRELNVIFNRLRLEDQLLSQEDISEIPPNILAKICFDRGIDLDKGQREQVEDLRLWLSISNLRNVPHSLLLMHRVLDFTRDSIVDDEETQQNEAMIQVSARFSALHCLASVLRERTGEEEAV